MSMSIPPLVHHHAILSLVSNHICFNWSAKDKYTDIQQYKLEVTIILVPMLNTVPYKQKLLTIKNCLGRQEYKFNNKQTSE